MMLYSSIGSDNSQKPNKQKVKRIKTRAIIVYFHFDTENEAEFSRPLKDVTVTEGESATFRCDVNKIPKDATITWYLNDKLVSNDKRITTAIEGKRLVMTINDTTLDDEGRVKVQVGKSVSEAKLRIEGK